MKTLSNSDYALLIACTEGWLECRRQIDPNPPNKQYNAERKARLMLARLKRKKT